jgi:peptide/nickel transport system substrate-binding protein
MERNTAYWGKGPVGFNRVIWRPVPDDTARVAGLTTGEYDIATNVPISNIQDINRQRDRRVIETPSYRIFQLILSSLEEHPSALHDKRVRQAVNHAIDKKAIIDNLFEGKAFALNGQLLRQSQLGYDPSLKDYAFDLAKARALLTEAGHPNGIELTFKFPTGRYAQDREVSEAIAGMLAKAGIRTRMVSLEPGEFLRQLRNRELQPMAYIGLAPLDDPDFQLAQYRSSWRYAYIRNAELDGLIDAGAREIDVAKRREIYQKAGRLMHDLAPVAFLFGGFDFYGVNRKLEGFVPRGDQSHTVDSFGDEWNHFNFAQFRQNWLEHTVRNTFGSTEAFRGKVMVDAGAGSGTGLAIVRTGAGRIGPPPRLMSPRAGKDTGFSACIGLHGAILQKREHSR